MAQSAGMTDSTGISWHDWGARPFEEARRMDRPVLLVGQAKWCADSRTLRERVFSSAAVASDVQAATVPVRFDADRMPHVRDRYNAGGWPITTLLTPDGDILWAGRVPTAEHMTDTLRRVNDAWHARRSQINEEVKRRALAEELSDRRMSGGLVRREAADDVLTAAQQYFDERNGGFGEGFKLILPDIIELLLVQAYRTDNPDWVTMAARTLDGILAGEMEDAERGGFFRLARNADWTDPSTEKLLEANAWALRSFGLAAHLLERDDWRDAATRTVAWADASLGLPDGLWGASQAARGHADNGGAAVDRTVLTDACGQWIAALAEIGGRLGQDDWVTRAESSLVTLLDSMGGDSGLLHHFREEGGEPELPGLLSDMVECCRACVAVGQATGDAAWLERAIALLDTIQARFWTPEGGYNDIADSVESVGALRRSARPFETNAGAALAMLDVAQTEAGHGWRAVAERTLATLSPLAGRYGIAGAGFALAVEHFFEPPRFFAIVGKGAAAKRLRRAALAVPIAERHVWSLPDGGSIGTRRFEPADKPVVYACTSLRCSSPMSSTTDLRTPAAPAI